MPGALVCCLFGWLAAVPAWSLLCAAFLELGFTALSAGGRRWSPGASSMCPLAWWFGLLPFRLVVGGALLASAMLGLLFWWLDLLPFQLVVGGPCLVPACHACLVAGSAATSGAVPAWRPLAVFVRLLACLLACLLDCLLALVAPLLPSRLVVGGPCLVPACHACLVFRIAAFLG